MNIVTGYMPVYFFLHRAPLKGDLSVRREHDQAVLVPIVGRDEENDPGATSEKTWYSKLRSQIFNDLDKIAFEESCVHAANRRADAKQGPSCRDSFPFRHG